MLVSRHYSRQRFTEPSATDAELRWARTCYDHLAGTVAVALADTLVADRVIVVSDGRYQLGPGPSTALVEFGIDLDATARTRRSFAHPCLDWSERRHHVAGALGAALLVRMVDLGWVSRHPNSRAVVVHPSGRKGGEESLGCALPEFAAAAPANLITRTSSSAGGAQAADTSYAGPTGPFRPSAPGRTGGPGEPPGPFDPGEANDEGQGHLNPRRDAG